MGRSGGFPAAIEALNIAYEVQDDRPFWKTRPLAVELACITGSLMLIALSVMIVGPKFGEWLAGRVHLSSLFVFLWPYIHWSIAVGFTILAVETIYYLALNVKLRFVATLPGATMAVGCWIALSYLLGMYFRHFANFNKTYGTLGAAIALMTWLYWTGFAMLLGAELKCRTREDQSRRKAKKRSTNLSQLPELILPLELVKIHSDACCEDRNEDNCDHKLTHSEYALCSYRYPVQLIKRRGKTRDSTSRAER